MGESQKTNDLKFSIEDSIIWYSLIINCIEMSEDCFKKALLDSCDLIFNEICLRNSLYLINPLICQLILADDIRKITPEYLFELMDEGIYKIKNKKDVCDICMKLRDMLLERIERSVIINDNNG